MRDICMWVHVHGPTNTCVHFLCSNLVCITFLPICPTWNFLIVRVVAKGKGQDSCFLTFLAWPSFLPEHLPYPRGGFSSSLDFFWLQLKILLGLRLAVFIISKYSLLFLQRTISYSSLSPRGIQKIGQQGPFPMPCITTGCQVQLDGCLMELTECESLCYAGTHQRLITPLGLWRWVERSNRFIF